MDESIAFLEKAKSKLISSKALYEIGQYGDSVGRSYYAMFLSAKALLVKEGYDVSSHRSLISIFGKEFVKNGDFDNGIAKYLSGTQSLRDNADYDAIDTISKEIAHERIIQAEKFIKEAEKFL
ncbi:MAG: HEPN domain-containing protein [Methanobrevibacter sp.]|nr:HEPN domain-containing protein [Methanobrevibacter sp.]